MSLQNSLSDNQWIKRWWIWIPKEDTYEIVWWVWRPKIIRTSTCVLYYADKYWKILWMLCIEHEKCQRIHPPWWKWEPWEDSPQACRREVWEEANVGIRITGRCADQKNAGMLEAVQVDMQSYNLFWFPALDTLFFCRVPKNVWHFSVPWMCLLTRNMILNLETIFLNWKEYWVFPLNIRSYILAQVNR